MKMPSTQTPSRFWYDRQSVESMVNWRRIDLMNFPGTGLIMKWAEDAEHPSWLNELLRLHSQTKTLCVIPFYKMPKIIFKLGTDQHEITPGKLSKSLTSSISCANIILFLLDVPTPGQWRLLSCEATLDVVAMALHACAALIAPQGHWDLFPSVWWFLWLCTHGTSTPAYSIVCRNVAGIWSVWVFLLLQGL